MPTPVRAPGSRQKSGLTRYGVTPAPRSQPQSRTRAACGARKAAGAVLSWEKLLPAACTESGLEAVGASSAAGLPFLCPSVWHKGAFALSRPARSAALPAAPSPGKPLPGGQLRSPRLAGHGGKFKRETSSLTSLRLEWTLL